MTTPTTDPDTEEVLAEFAAAEGPSFDEMSISEKRQGLEALLLDAEAHAPEVTVTDITVPVRGGRAISGLALHPGGDGPLPVLFLVQGGGWSLSAAKPYLPLGALLAKELRRLVVIVDFRLAPEHKFPAGLEDCIDTYQWLRGEAQSLGGDPADIALFGDSAGGNLAAAVALVCATEGQVLPNALVLAYPMIDVRGGAPARYPSRTVFGGGDFFLTEASIQSAVDYYLADDSLRGHPLVSLAENPNLGRLPKTILILPGLDPLRDEALAFARQLGDQGVNVHVRVFEGTIHAFLSFFHRIGLAHEAVAKIKSLL